MPNIFKLVASILICHAAGFIGGYFTSQTVTTWYETINKPSFQPPGWLFGPVWLTLYTLMGVSLYMVWMTRRKKVARRKALYLFYAHLILNASWSIFFFGLQNPEYAFYNIVILLFLIIWVMIKFFKLNRVASYLLIPYLLWVSFAAYLNYTIWLLNK